EPADVGCSCSNQTEGRRNGSSWLLPIAPDSALSDLGELGNPGSSGGGRRLALGRAADGGLAHRADNRFLRAEWDSPLCSRPVRVSSVDRGRGNQLCVY